MREAYTRMGLNARQIEVIARALPKRQYYLQSRRGNRLFDLALGPIALAICGASATDEQRLIDRLLHDFGAAWFPHAFVTARAPAWAKDLLLDFDNPPAA